MQQRHRLVPCGQPQRQRAVERRRIAVPARIVWKDATGATRLAPVITRDVSEQGVAVDCLGGMPIPAFRLVYLLVDRDARMPDLPQPLRTGVLAAVFRVDPCSPATGAPTGYALRLLVEPPRPGASLPAAGQTFRKPKRLPEAAPRTDLAPRRWSLPDPSVADGFSA
jgi:hypothetical protein